MFHRLIATSLLLTILIASPVTAQPDQESDTASRVEQAAKNLVNQQTYLLQYRFQPGETLKWNVEHTASTKAQIAGTMEESSSRSQSVKVWTIQQVDDNGNIEFVHSIESVELWQQVGEEEPETFDSKTDQSTPPAFAAVREKIGKPLATIKIAPNGQILERKSESQQTNFGVGEICIPFPETAIPIDHQWYVPTTLSGKDEDGVPHQLKARVNYKLIKVKDGLAYISFRTEVLTPIDNEKVHSQILQHLNSGYAVFNIRDGRMVRKEVEWNEKVQGYEGADSYLQYVGRLSERLLTPGSANAAADNATSQRDPVKKAGDKPTIRK